MEAVLKQTSEIIMLMVRANGARKLQLVGHLASLYAATLPNYSLYASAV